MGWVQTGELLEVVHQTLTNIAVAEMLDLTFEFIVAVQQVLHDKPPHIRTFFTEALENVSGNRERYAGFENPGRSRKYAVASDCLFTEDVPGCDDSYKDVTAYVGKTFELDKSGIEKVNVVGRSSA